MKLKLFEYLIKRREELSEEGLRLYFKLYPTGRLTVGFEYDYIYMWMSKPNKGKEKICSKYINFDTLTDKKIEDFISKLEKQIIEIQSERRKGKKEVSCYVMEIDMAVSSIEI